VAAIDDNDPTTEPNGPDPAAPAAAPADGGAPAAEPATPPADADAAVTASAAPGDGDPAPSPSDSDQGAPAPAGDAPAATEAAVAADAPASGGSPTDGDAAQADAPDASAPGDGTQAEGDSAQADAAPGEGDAAQGGGKRRRRNRRRSGGGGGRGGRRRFQWDEIFLRQRLDLLRAMDPDARAVEWAVGVAGRFDVAEILAGEGSSGKEFGRRAYGAKPETDDQAAWIILAAVRARDILPHARAAIAGTTDQRQQVKDAIEHIGSAKIGVALQSDRPTQQLFAERARRVDVASEGGEAQKAAWALLALARTADVQHAMTPQRSERPRRPGGDRRGGPSWGDDRGGRRRREPGIPGGVFSSGDSGIGGELGRKLREALAAQEAERAAAEEPSTPAADAPPADAAPTEAVPDADVTPEAPADEPTAADASAPEAGDPPADGDATA